jgi:hypothetical protein
MIAITAMNRAGSSVLSPDRFLRSVTLADVRWLDQDWVATIAHGDQTQGLHARLGRRLERKEHRLEDPPAQPATSGRDMIGEAGALTRHI